AHRAPRAPRRRGGRRPRPGRAAQAGHRPDGRGDMAEAVDQPSGRDPEPHELLPERVPETLPDTRTSTELGFPGERPPPSTHAPRFRMITGALVGIAVGALAATGLLIAGGKPDKGPAWSQWKPSEHSVKDGADE